MTQESWADRLGDRAWEMRNDWGALLGWAFVGLLGGSLVGGIPGGPSFGEGAAGGGILGMLVYCVTWLTMGFVALAGWLVELLLGLVRWLLRRLRPSA